MQLSALRVFTNPDAAPDVGYAREPLLAGLGVTFDKVPPRVFTHLEQRTVRNAGENFSVQLAPGLAFKAVQVADGIARLTLASGATKRVPVRCETRLDYAEPRELLRSFLAGG